MEQFRGYRSDGIFTPPSVQGSLLFPGNGGGINWGGTAWDRERNLLAVNQLRVPFWVKLRPRPEGQTWGNQHGTPYNMTRAPFMAPDGSPCFKPPWGTLTVVDLSTGRVTWEIPLGYMADLADVPEAREWGSPNMDGPAVTAGGLVFIAAAMDDQLRAFDIETGTELWRAELPAGGQATPMTYELNGKQYVVIAAGGHPNFGASFGDYVVAFALP